MMTTSCAMVHHLAHLLQVSLASVNAHYEAVGVPVATAIVLAAELVVTVVYQH